MTAAKHCRERLQLEPSVRPALAPGLRWLQRPLRGSLNMEPALWLTLAAVVALGSVQLAGDRLEHVLQQVWVSLSGLW